MKNAPEARILLLAEKATPGPREADTASGIVWFGVGDAGDERQCYDVWSENEADTLLVAALSPSTVKAICRVVEAARARKGYHSGDCLARADREWPNDGDCICGQQALDAALATLDAEGESRE